MAHPPQHGLGHVIHPKKTPQVRGLRRFLMAWHVATQMVYQASVSAQMFCAQDKA
jgi:hypothetical protein